MKEMVVDDDKNWINETNNWMKDIEDKTSIAKLYVPGTHGSATFHWGSAYKCQTWSIDKQLEEGIRFLDVHVRKYENFLYVYQWSSYQYIRLSDILHTVLKYLRTNSSESVFIRIWEDKVHMSDPGIWNIIFDIVTRIGVQNFWLKNAIPTLGEVRGTIVFLKNFNGSEMGIEHNLLKELQEASVPTLFSLRSAWENIEQHLQKMKANFENKLYLSYCNGASWGAYPDLTASYFNSRLLEFLRKKKKKKRELMYGIIAMNFPDHYIVEKIIECNF